MKPSDICSSFAAVIMTAAAALAGLVLVCQRKSTKPKGSDSSEEEVEDLDEEQWKELERKGNNAINSRKNVSWWVVGQHYVLGFGVLVFCILFIASKNAVPCRGSLVENEQKYQWGEILGSIGPDVGDETRFGGNFEMGATKFDRYRSCI
jgi:hypothetical protein